MKKKLEIEKKNNLVKNKFGCKKMNFEIDKKKTINFKCNFP